MDIGAILTWALELIKTQSFGGTVTTALTWFGSIVFFATVVIKLTPTKKDDEKLAQVRESWAGKIISFIENFSIISRKEEAPAAVLSLKSKNKR